MYIYIYIFFFFLFPCSLYLQTGLDSPRKAALKEPGSPGLRLARIKSSDVNGEDNSAWKTGQAPPRPGFIEQGDCTSSQFTNKHPRRDEHAIMYSSIWSSTWRTVSAPYVLFEETGDDLIEALSILTKITASGAQQVWLFMEKDKPLAMVNSLSLSFLNFKVGIIMLPHKVVNTK